MGTGSWMFLTLIATLLLISTFANGARIRGPQHIVKTIKADGGDIVDCVDMYKQPAFTHPLLVNHTIQTRPSKVPSVVRSKNGEFKPKVYQTWHKSGRCPNGSIPIKRQHNSNHHFKKKYALFPQAQGSFIHKHSVIETQTSAGTIHGGRATLNVWNPNINADGFSLSQIWLIAGRDADSNTMEAGWHVFPGLNGDSQPRTFIYWTSDGYRSTGCYDLKCPGFVQTNSEFLIGAPLGFSTYDGQQEELSLSIEKDTSTGNWWLYINGNPIGYWPPSLFTSIANAADFVEWGGEVCDTTAGTSNQMGSGHFSNEGYKRSSYTRGINYIDTSNNVIQPSSEDLATIIAAPSCYDLQMDKSTSELYLFFGGPGCP